MSCVHARGGVGVGVGVDVGGRGGSPGGLLALVDFFLVGDGRWMDAWRRRRSAALWFSRAEGRPAARQLASQASSSRSWRRIE